MRFRMFFSWLDVCYFRFIGLEKLGNLRIIPGMETILGKSDMEFTKESVLYNADTFYPAPRSFSARILSILRIRDTLYRGGGHNDRKSGIVYTIPPPRYSVSITFVPCLRMSGGLVSNFSKLVKNLLIRQ